MTESTKCHLLKKINKKVDTITYLVAARAMRGFTPEASVIRLLLFDFSVKDISKIINRPTKEVNRIIREWRKQPQ